MDDPTLRSLLDTLSIFNAYMGKERRVKTVLKRRNISCIYELMIPSEIVMERIHDAVSKYLLIMERVKSMEKETAENINGRILTQPEPDL